MKIILLSLLFVVFCSPANAQMFSLEDNSRSTQGLSSSFIRIGYAPTDFSFKGNEAVVLPANRLDFSDPALNIGFETPYLSASASFINGLTGSDDRRYLFLELNYNNEVPFIRTRKLRAGIPVILMTSLISARNDNSTTEFSQSSFGAGVGVFSNFRFSENAALNLKLAPHYGFSNSAAGLFGGTNSGLMGSVRLNIGGILPSNSISLGYDYKLSSYDIDDEEFDYDLKYHLVTLGISF